DMRLRLEDARDRRGHALPGAGFGLESPATARRRDVVLRAPVVLGGAPLAADPPRPLEAAEGGEERTGVDLEHAAAHLRETQADAVAVHRLERHRFQDEHVERSGKERLLAFGHATPPLDKRGESTRWF